MAIWRHPKQVTDVVKVRMQRWSAEEAGWSRRGTWTVLFCQLTASRNKFMRGRHQQIRSARVLLHECMRADILNLYDCVLLVARGSRQEGEEHLANEGTMIGMGPPPRLHQQQTPPPPRPGCTAGGVLTSRRGGTCVWSLSSVPGKEGGHQRAPTGNPNKPDFLWLSRWLA